MNIGAKLPPDYGDYFASGSITPNVGKDIVDSLIDAWGRDVYYVIRDSIDIVTANPDFDAATAIWGSAWRMPSRSDFQELRKKCEWVWTSYTTVEGENVPGYKVIGPNGNTIFLPAAGYRYEGYLGGVEVNVKGYYRYNLSDFSFNNSERDGSWSCRYEELASIRPVVSSKEWLSQKKILDQVVNHVRDSVFYVKYGYLDSVFNELALQTSIKAVDLGLSVKWANMNVGAKSPVDYGNYFAWGEVKPKDSYTSANSLTHRKAEFNFDIAGNVKYDAATANWGGKWKMPTTTQMRELRHCTWVWISSSKLDAAGNTISGYIVSNCAVGNTNSIFLPAAGFRYGSDLEIAGSFGYYWSSTLSEGSSYDAYFLDFYSDYQCVINDGRYYGLSVRPVLE